MTQTNPFRLAVDAGMILAFTLTAFFALTSATIPVLAGDGPLAPTGSHSLTAAGTEQVSAEPNTVTAVIGLEVLRPTVREAVSDAQAVMTDVWGALRAGNIAESDIRAGHFSIYSDRFGPAGVLHEDQMHYHASNTVFITIRDLDSIDAVLDAVIDAGANNIYSVDFTLPVPAAVETGTRAGAGRRLGQN